MGWEDRRLDRVPERSLFLRLALLAVPGMSVVLMGLALAVLLAGPRSEPDTWIISLMLAAGSVLAIALYRSHR